MITKDEKKRLLNVLRNKHHFKKSDAELQAFWDDLKKQQWNKTATLDKEKNEREDNS